VIKRKLNRRPIYEYRCDERLKLKVKDVCVSHTLGCTGDWNTTIETRLTDEMSFIMFPGGYRVCLFIMKR
jgi:hypothetical protein